MANTILTQDLLAQYVSAYFRNYNKAVYLSYMPLDTDFDKDINGYNVGDTLRFRLPTYTNVSDGIVANPIDLQERFRTLTLDRPINSAWNPNLLQLTTDMDSNEKILKRFVEPSIIKMANKVDRALTQGLEDTVYRVSGTAGAGVSSFATFRKARGVLDKFGVDGDKSALMNIDDGVNLQSALANFFNDKINTEIDVKGQLGSLADVMVYEDQNIAAHQNGTFAAGGNVTVASNVLTGATTISLTGFTPTQTGVLLKGDIIRVAGVFGVNPVSLASVGLGTDNLATFIVGQDVNSDGGGNATVNISPTIIFEASNPYNNVTRLPVATDIVTIVGAANGTYTNNFMFSKEAILLSIKPYFRPVGLPDGAYGSYMDQETGINFSVVDWFEGINYTNLKRIDLLFGLVIQPEYCVRLIG